MQLKLTSTTAKVCIKVCNVHFHKNLSELKFLIIICTRRPSSKLPGATTLWYLFCWLAAELTTKGCIFFTDV